MEVNGDTAAGFLKTLFQNGRSAFGRLWDQAKSFSQNWPRNVGQVGANIDVSGGGVMGASGSIPGGSSGGGGLGSGNLSGGALSWRWLWWRIG